MNPSWNIPILCYHHVSPSIDYYTNTPPDIFARHMRALAGRYEFWTLQRAAEAFARDEDPSGKVVVTFDDGYEDNYAYAAPLLDEVGAKATFFVLPKFAGADNSWNPKAHYRVPHMNWEQTRQLADAGHEIGSHGLTHRPMDTLDLHTNREEIESSKALIEDRLGREVTTFSYPYGITRPDITEVVEQCYRAAVSTVKSRNSHWAAGAHALRRVYLPVTATDSDINDIMEGKVIQ